MEEPQYTHRIFEMAPRNKSSVVASKDSVGNLASGVPDRDQEKPTYKNELEKPKPTLASFPREMILHIMKISSKPGILNGPALGLGLTCRLFYALLKSDFDLKVLSKLHPAYPQNELIIRLIAWFLQETTDSEYRRIYIRDFGWWFLNTEVYGRNKYGEYSAHSVHGWAEWAWRKGAVYKPGADHAQEMLELRCSFIRAVDRNWRLQGAGCCLPSPRGMGNDWYARAMEIVMSKKWRAMMVAEVLGRDDILVNGVEDYIHSADYLNLGMIREWIRRYSAGALKELGGAGILQ